MDIRQEVMNAAFAANEEELFQALKLLQGEVIVSGFDTPEAIDSQELISKTQAAKKLGVSRTTLWRMVGQGIIKPVSLGPGMHDRVRLSDIQDMIAAR